MQSDTSRATLEARIAAIRRLGPEGRLKLAAELSEDVRRISIEGLRQRRPELSYEQARREILQHVWGDALARRVWPELMTSEAPVVGARTKTATTARLSGREHVDRWAHFRRKVEQGARRAGVVIASSKRSAESTSILCALPPEKVELAALSVT